MKQAAGSVSVPYQNIRAERQLCPTVGGDHEKVRAVVGQTPIASVVVLDYRSFMSRWLLPGMRERGLRRATPATRSQVKAVKRSMREEPVPVRPRS